MDLLVFYVGYWYIPLPLPSVLADLIPSYIALCFSMAQQKISSSPKESSLPPSQSSDSAVEKAVAKTIDSIRSSLNPYYDTITPEEEAVAAIKISAATENHFRLQIMTLQNAPRDESKLREILEKKQRQYQRAEDSEIIERLVTEIEMLKYVLFLVRKHGRNSFSSP